VGQACRQAPRIVRATSRECDGCACGIYPTELACCDAAVGFCDARRLTLRELMLERFAMQAGNVVGVGSYAPSYEKANPETGQSPDMTPFWMFGGAGAATAGDMESGRVDVTKLVSVAGVGRGMNASIVERPLGGEASR